MHFLSDAIAELEGLLEVNRDFCKKQMAEKAFASAADELCGSALSIVAQPELVGKNECTHFQLFSPASAI